MPKKYKPRVPTKIAEAVQYVKDTDDILQVAAVPPAVTAGARLGLLDTVVTAWHNRRVKVENYFNLASSWSGFAILTLEQKDLKS